MKRLAAFIFIFWLFSTTLFAQKAELLVTLGRTSCGEFMLWMDGVVDVLKKSSDSKIYVVYYGARYRRESVWNKKIKDYEKTKLSYPHREDGLNWAKAIPLYLTSVRRYEPEIRDFLKDKIVLTDGGFREDISMELWLVPKNAKLPEPTPTIAEKDIKFRTDKPRSVPDYTTCYEEY